MYSFTFLVTFTFFYFYCDFCLTSVVIFLLLMFSLRSVWYFMPFTNLFFIQLHRVALINNSIYFVTQTNAAIARAIMQIIRCWFFTLY